MNPSPIAPYAVLTRLRNITRRITVLAMLASVIILPVFRADAQPGVSSAYINVKSYTGNGSSSNTMALDYRTSVQTMNWTRNVGGVETAYSLHAIPTYNYWPIFSVTYDPWNIDFTNYRTVWPPDVDQTGTNVIITGKLGINPQWPTAITNFSLFSNPPGTYPPYYYVMNIFPFPPLQNVTNITTGVLQPVFPPLWPHYSNVKAFYTDPTGAQTSASTNSATVAVDLYTAHSYNTAVLGRPNKFTLLSATATTVNDNWVPVTIIGFTNISVAGEVLNADYKAFVKKPPAIVVDATPSVTSYSNFCYNVWVESHKIVKLSRRFHFLFYASTNVPPPVIPSIDALRDKFDAGAELLSKDDDFKVPDNDKSVIPPNAEGHDPLLWDEAKYNYDDVPLYVEFVIEDGSTVSPSNQPLFPLQFTGKRFYDITTDSDLDELYYSQSANILQVNTIKYPAPLVAPLAVSGGNTMVIPLSVHPSVLMHEWGHMAGLEHRGESFTNFVVSYDPTTTGYTTNAIITTPNPGPEYRAIMGGANSPPSTANSVNRRERNAYILSNTPFIP